MGLLYDGRILITDASNVPVNGGKVRVYDAGTTNLSSVFSDAALSVPLTNPVVANSAGITPQIFAADGLLVDIQYLTSADAEIANRGYQDVSFLGSSTGDLSRTVTGDGRFTITGSAGAVLFRVGDPSPDNTGGTLTIEGWAGTQGDTLTLDFATTNTSGRFNENGKRLPSIVHNVTTFTAQTNVDFALPEWVDGLRAWRITVFDLQLSASTGNIRLRLAYDGVPTFKTGASDYQGYLRYGILETGGAAAAYLDLTVGAETATGENGLIVLEVLTPDSGTDSTIIYSRAHMYNNGATSPTITDGTQYGLGSYGRATHVRLYDSAAGTLTCKVRVEPMYGFGEV